MTKPATRSSIADKAEAELARPDIAHPEPVPKNLASQNLASPNAANRERLIGIGLMCAALATFSVLDASAKWASQFMHPMQAVWSRYIVSVIIVTALISPWTRRAAYTTRAPRLQAARSLTLLMSTALNFIALQYLQLAEAISIIFATPLVIASLSGPFLGEWPGPRRMLAIGVGFLGVLVVMRPGAGALHPAAFLCVIGVFCYAFYNLLTRKLASLDSSETTMVFSGAAGVVLVTPLMPFLWITPPGWQVWGAMLLMGACGAFGHWLIIGAHRRAPASVLAPFIYTQLVWMLVLGWLVFDQWPDGWTLAGGMIVVSSGLYLLYRERVRGADVNRVA